MAVVKASKVPILEHCQTKVVDFSPKTGNMFFSSDIGMHVLERDEGE